MVIISKAKAIKKQNFLYFTQTKQCQNDNYDMLLTTSSLRPLHLNYVIFNRAWVIGKNHNIMK